MGFQRLEDIGNAQINLPCSSKSRSVTGWQRGCWWLHAIFCQLVAMAWTTERGSSFRPWLTCWWILNSHLLEEILNSHCAAPRLRKGPAEQGRKFKTWGKVSWLWAITRRKIQIYGKLALAGEKASALPSSGSGVSHWKRFLSALLYGRIFRWNHLWQQLRRTYNTLPILLESNVTTVAHKSAIFKNCPFTEFSQLYLILQYSTQYSILIIIHFCVCLITFTQICICIEE